MIQTNLFECCEQIPRMMADVVVVVAFRDYKVLINAIFLACPHLRLANKCC